MNIKLPASTYLAEHATNVVPLPSLPVSLNDRLATLRSHGHPSPPPSYYQPHSSRLYLSGSEFEVILQKFAVAELKSLDSQPEPNVHNGTVMGDLLVSIVLGFSSRESSMNLS